MTHLTYRLATLLLAAVLVTPPEHGVQADEAALDAIHQKIVRKYDSVEHITSTALTRSLANNAEAKDIVLFDVREIDEHAVSHLGQATRITPGIWTSTFMKAHGDKIRGKTVVFYCSVGRRSSYAASYLQDTLKKNGAARVVNLKGGIFSWHNQERPLTTGATQTRFVHPFNKYWGRLIVRNELTRFKPEPSSPVSGAVSETAAGAATGAVPTAQ